MRFVIAGKLHGRKAQIMRREMEGWELPKGELFAAPRDEQQKSAPTLIRRKEASNLTFGWSIIMPRNSAMKKLNAMKVLDHILTGTMHSRIYGAART